MSYPKTSQVLWECPSALQEHPKTSPGGAQNAPRAPQEHHKRRQEHTNRSLGAPRGAKSTARPSQEAPGSSPNWSNRHLEHSNCTLRHPDLGAVCLVLLIYTL